MFIGVTPTILRPSLLSAILKPQDVFQTVLYSGTGAARNITHGVELGTRGGLAWVKSRSAASSNQFADTLRGGGRLLSSNTTAAEALVNGTISDLYNKGISLGADPSSVGVNVSGETYAAQIIGRAPGFFDIVTWTGDGTSNRQIPHGLGVVPGMVIVKRRDAASPTGWPVSHRSRPVSTNLWLNLADAEGQGATALWPSGGHTDAYITIGSTANINASGGTYVAYLVAHDPSVDGIVQCGSFTTDASGLATITLGWQPQFLIGKCSSQSDSWFVMDTTRGWGAGADKQLYPNLTNAEGISDRGAPTATGFTAGPFLESSTFIYLAIRAPY